MRSSWITYLAISSLTSAAAASPIEVQSQTPAPLEERQVATGILSWIATLIEPKMFGTPLVCAADFATEGNFYAIAGSDHNGNTFLSCWRNDTDTVEFGPDEANVAKCLTNLPFTQTDVCIDVKGSMCDGPSISQTPNGYTESGGQLQNLRANLIGKGTQSDSHLTANQSVTLQAAIGAIVGQRVRETDVSPGEDGPYFHLTTDIKGTNSLLPDWEINWIGDNNDC